MKDFFNFMRHMLLVNWKITTYSCKEISCIFKRGRPEPDANPDEILEYTEKMLRTGKSNHLPIKAYEYDCCVEYLKKIRSCLFNSQEDFRKLFVVFDDIYRYRVVTPSIENSLFKVAAEVGFRVVDEKISDDDFECTLESIYSVRT